MSLSRGLTLMLYEKGLAAIEQVVGIDKHLGGFLDSLVH
jgi:hypothetical protein